MVEESDEQAVLDKGHAPWLGKIPWSAIVIASMVLWFARPGLFVYLTGDDLMNLFGAWQKPISRIVADNILLSSPAYRPMGTLVYRLLFAWAGLHALPFRLVCFSLILLNCFLTYRVAAALSTKEVGVITALLGCYNAGYIDLYYNTGTIYDLLCYTFYFFALDLYARTRQRQAYLSPAGLIAFLILYICALNSKEMAVTLPPVLLGCELIFGRRWISSSGDARKDFIVRWRPIALSAAIAFVFVFGRLSSNSPLAGNDAYRLHPDVATYLSSWSHYLPLLAYEPTALSLGFTILALCLPVAGVLLVRERALTFALFFTLIAQLPIAFIALRGAYAMYIPAFGIALYLALLLVTVRDRLTAFAHGDEIVSASTTSQIITFLICVVTLVTIHQSHPLEEPSAADGLVRSSLEQIAKLPLAVHPGSRILFLDDPFAKDDGGTLAQILMLHYRTLDLSIDRAKALPAPPSQAGIDSYDIVLDYKAPRIVSVRP